MQIIPVINCASAQCVNKKLHALAKFSPRVRKVHIDVGEKPVSATRVPISSRALQSYAKRFFITLHCMVSEKHFFSRMHMNSGARLVYYHLREIKDMARFEAMVREWEKKGIAVGVVVRADDTMRGFRFPKGVLYVLVLAVKPGPAGQKFNPRATKLISFLRKKFPRGILTVDGGITPAIAKILAHAGADAVTSSAYIWESKDPQEAYKRLINFNVGK